jgi:hypothetical protein
MNSLRVGHFVSSYVYGEIRVPLALPVPAGATNYAAEAENQKTLF